MDSEGLDATMDSSAAVPTSCMEVVTLPIMDADQVTWTRLLDNSGLNIQSIPVVDSSGQPITVSVNMIDSLQGAESDIVGLPINSSNNGVQSVMVKSLLPATQRGQNISWSDATSLLTPQVVSRAASAALSNVLETAVTSLGNDNTLNASLTDANSFGRVLDNISQGQTNVIKVSDLPGTTVIQQSSKSDIIADQNRVDKGSEAAQMNVVFHTNSVGGLTQDVKSMEAPPVISLGNSDFAVQTTAERSKIESCSTDIGAQKDTDKIADSADQIFSKIDACISAEILSIILNLEASFLNDFTESLTWSQRLDTNSWSVSGSIFELFSLQQRFTKLMTGKTFETGFPRPEMKSTSTQTEPPQLCDFSAMCDILVPAVSAYGRGIKQPARFNQNYNDLHLDSEDFTQDGRDERTRISRRKRKIPRRAKIFYETSEVGRVTKSNESSKQETQHDAKQTTHTSGETVTGEQSEDKSDSTTETDNRTADRTTENDASSKENLPRNSKRHSERHTWKKTKKDYEALAPFKFFCNVCSFKTKRHSHYVKHLKLHTDSGPLYECQHCNFKTIRNSTLKRHEVTHSDVFYHCDKCKYVTDKSVLLFKHKKLKHSGNQEVSQVKEKIYFQCGKCSYKTTKAYSYGRHLQTHGKDFMPVDNQLVEAVRAAEFQCDQCDYKTIRREHYVRHMNNVHSDHRPYLCDLCGRSFKRNDALTQHKLTHIDKQFRKYQFKCKVCEKDFRSQAHLTEHMSMHSNARQYLCDICGAAFKTKSCQLKHVKSIHQNPRSYPCDHCSKRFNTKFALKRHDRTHDQPPLGITVEEVSKPEELSQIESQIASQTFVLQQTPDLTEQDIITPTMEEYEQANLQGSESAAAILHLSNSLQLNMSYIDGSVV